MCPVGFGGASWRLVRSLGLRLGRKQVGGRAALASGAGVIGSGSGAAADHGFDGLVNLEGAVDLILPGPCAASLLGAAGAAGRCWAWLACGRVVFFLPSSPSPGSTWHPALQGSTPSPQPASRVAREMECPTSH